MVKTVLKKNPVKPEMGSKTEQKIEEGNQDEHLENNFTKSTEAV
jgi:hypothetical protein